MRRFGLKVHFLIFSLNVTFFEKSFNCDEIWRKISALAKIAHIQYLHRWLIRKNLTQKQAFAYFSQTLPRNIFRESLVMPVYFSQAFSLASFMSHVCLGPHAITDGSLVSDILGPGRVRENR